MKYRRPSRRRVIGAIIAGAVAYVVTVMAFVALKVLGGWLTWDFVDMAILAALSLPGAVVAVAVIDIRRHALGDCQRCGYDLTGNVSGVCPECGQEI